MAAIVVILDFDETIIDVDSDYWVVDELGLTELFNQLLPTMSLNSVMTRIMKELHSQGTTIQQIAHVLKHIPIHPQIVNALKSAYALECELRIISDANTFFIDTILEHLGLRDCFSEIHTNPGFVDEEGRLNILPFHDFIESPHGCYGHCPPNMCKGNIIQGIQTSLSKEGNSKIIYVGDGAGDFCPGLKLTNVDYLMPRKNFPVWDLICRDPMVVKAEIHGWADGEEFERILLQIIGAISVHKSAQFSSIDFKLPPTISVPAHKASSKALCVT